MFFKETTMDLVPELNLFPEKNFFRSIGIQSKEISMHKTTISLLLSISININIYIYKNVTFTRGFFTLSDKSFLAVF